MSLSQRHAEEVSMYNTCVVQLYDIGLDYHQLTVSILD